MWVPLASFLGQSNRRMDGLCKGLYVMLALQAAQNLQLVQNAAARVLSGARKTDHTKQIVFQLPWFHLLLDSIQDYLESPQ